MPSPNGAHVRCVAPLAGAWIEIRQKETRRRRVWSLPSREHGLKYVRIGILKHGLKVVPLAGAWIEIADMSLRRIREGSLPSGGVD